MGVSVLISIGIGVLLPQFESRGQESAKEIPGPINPSPITKADVNDRPTKNSRTMRRSGRGQTRTELKSDAPRIRTKAEEAERARKSLLLGTGRTDGERYVPDDTDAPPWRESSFFGIRARGQFFIYVIDHSGSMLDEDRFTRAKIELRRSVFALQPPQRFEVIFYNDEATPMPGGPTPRSADTRSKNQLVSWLSLMGPDGETNPRDAIAQALALRPDAIFLLSDGEFPVGTVESITRLNRQKIPIHCIDLTGGLSGDHLKQIAHENGGSYAARAGSLQARP